jgi:hypothetical protein
MFVTPDEMPAMYMVLGASGAPGVKVAVKLALLYVTAPGTSAPEGSLSTNVELLTVDKFICWLNVAEMTAPRRTPVALSAGTVKTTSGTGSEVPELLPHPAMATRIIAPANAATRCIIALHILAAR